MTVDGIYGYGGRIAAPIPPARIFKGRDFSPQDAL